MVAVLIPLSSKSCRKRSYSTSPVGKSPEASSKSVSIVMKSNRASGTIPELKLAKLLRKKLVTSDLPGRPDIVYARSKVAIFIHGCFWHRCRVCDLPLPKTNTAFWRRKFQRNVERDQINRLELESMGWKVLEIWEHELEQNAKAVAARVKRGLSKRSRGSRERTST
jgi:DNA mismatch endonuclease, patch repair protein